MALTKARHELEDLGSRWRLLEVAYKPYPCCHYLQAAVEARQGEVLLSQGRQLVLGFRGAGRQINALYVLQEQVMSTGLLTT